MPLPRPATKWKAIRAVDVSMLKRESPQLRCGMFNRAALSRYGLQADDWRDLEPPSDIAVLAFKSQRNGCGSMVQKMRGLQRSQEVGDSWRAHAFICWQMQPFAERSDVLDVSRVRGSTRRHGRQIAAHNTAQLHYLHFYRQKGMKVRYDCEVPIISLSCHNRVRWSSRFIFVQFHLSGRRKQMSQ